MRGYYELQLQSGTIPLRFTAWTFTEFAQVNGNLTYSQLLEVFEFEVNEGGMTFKKLTPHHLTSLLLCAAKYMCRRDGRPFHYNDLDASDWIDEMGGVFSARTMEVIGEVIKALMPQGDPAPETEKNA